MVDLGLQREMRRVLLELEMTSNGKTASFNSGGRGEFASRPPVSGGCDLRSDPPHIYWRRKWNEATGDDGRRRVLDGAREELRFLRRAPPPPRDLREETEEERDERLLRDGDGWRVEEVATAFKMTPSAVRRVRRQHGRDPERGTDDVDLPMPYGSLEERRRRARHLVYERGLSMRAAALKMGVSHETVRRDLMVRGEEAKAA